MQIEVMTTSAAADSAMRSETPAKHDVPEQEQQLPPPPPARVQTVSPFPHYVGIGCYYRVMNAFGCWEVHFNFPSLDGSHYPLCDTFVDTSHGMPVVCHVPLSAAALTRTQFINRQRLELTTLVHAESCLDIPCNALVDCSALRESVGLARRCTHTDGGCASPSCKEWAALLKHYDNCVIESCELCEPARASAALLMCANAGCEMYS